MGNLFSIVEIKLWKIKRKTIFRRLTNKHVHSQALFFYRFLCNNPDKKLILSRYKPKTGWFICQKTGNFDHLFQTCPRVVPPEQGCLGFFRVRENLSASRRDDPGQLRLRSRPRWTLWMIQHHFIRCPKKNQCQETLYYFFTISKKTWFSRIKTKRNEKTITRKCCCCEEKKRDYFLVSARIQSAMKATKRKIRIMRTRIIISGQRLSALNPRDSSTSWPVE